MYMIKNHCISIKNVVHHTDCAYLFQFLTDEDFKKIRLREAVRQIDPKAGKKRKRGADHTEPSERSVLLLSVSYRKSNILVT